MNMGFLTDYVQPCVRYQGRVYYVTPSYDAVLNIQRMFREEEQLSQREKIDMALAILIDNNKAVSKLTGSERIQLLELIYQEHISLKERPRVGKSRKLVDFEEDGELIYASFLQDYGMDLIELQGKLSWKKFIALFEGLREKTKIKEVMRIRGMELPMPTKYNQKEIQQIQELKMYYALPVKGEGGNALDLLFSTLEQMAEKR